MSACFKCGTTIDGSSKVAFRDECPKCGSDLHCCLNCEFFDERSSNQCREPQVELVRDKDRANRCEYFVLRKAQQSKPSSSADAKQKFNDLFH